jgi:hypothetical protein
MLFLMDHLKPPEPFHLDTVLFYDLLADDFTEKSDKFFIHNPKTSLLYRHKPGTAAL